MPKFSEKSLNILKTIHPDLQKILNEAINYIDFTIVSGYRTPEEQLKLYNEGKSKLKFSKHNINPSLAVDIQPYPIDLNLVNKNDPKEIAKFYFLAGYIKSIADRMGIKIRWGGDWNRNLDFKDETFTDLYHFELDR
jgi:peptidoglycan L-alanyl-D-glutamate endopeptidase CwlK